MYSKVEASKLRQAFWTAFGQYMAPVPSADGMKINWVNYKTGVKSIQFRMEVDAKQASVSILISNSDETLRNSYYEKFVQLKPLFNSMVPGSWLWQQNTTDESDRTISTIETDLSGVNVFDQNSWPAIISFLKENMIALDAFWSNVKDGFEMLG